MKVVFFIKESKRHLGSLSSLGGIGVMVKEITGDEEMTDKMMMTVCQVSPLTFTTDCHCIIVTYTVDDF